MHIYILNQQHLILSDKLYHLLVLHCKEASAVGDLNTAQSVNVQSLTGNNLKTGSGTNEQPLLCVHVGKGMWTLSSVKDTIIIKAEHLET